jgi:hypothetical protein
MATLPLAHCALSLLVLFFCLATGASAQSRDLGAERLVLDDGAGHSLRISVPSTGWTGLGTFDWVIPVQPLGADPAGFVEEGSSVLNTLTWNSGFNYWQATPSTSVTGSGTVNTLPKWTGSGGALTNSLLSESGSTVTVTGFTKLGAASPAIKVETFTGTTASTQGGTTNISLGSISSSKIISITVLVDYASADAYIPASYTITGGYEFSWYTSGSTLTVWNAPANSASILTKPIKVMVTYTS